jgi:hypothetical protein
VRVSPQHSHERLAPCKPDERSLSHRRTSGNSDRPAAHRRARGLSASPRKPERAAGAHTLLSNGRRTGGDPCPRLPIEKQRTTPDVYPLSLDALQLACNQSTNRDPVVECDEHQIRAALQRLSRRGWVRLASRPSSRAVKYRHLPDEALSLSVPEQSLLAVLMLRGSQTAAELRTRVERLHPSSRSLTLMRR